MSKQDLTIALGADHGGFELKENIKSYLKKTRPAITILDLGTNSSESVDYPDFGQKVAQSILDAKSDLGILCCGTGIGISIAANRSKGIRAALVYNKFTAQMAKEHNNANIICLGSRTTEKDLANSLVDIWLDTKFEGGRHQKRLEKLEN
jgi:ribose 5-phosphate isomerase B